MILFIVGFFVGVLVMGALTFMYGNSSMAKQDIQEILKKEAESQGLYFANQGRNNIA